MDHRQRRQCLRTSQPRWKSRHSLDRVAVDHIAMAEAGQQASACCFCSFPGLGSAWSFLTGQIILGEPLLPRLALPVVVAHSPPVHDDPAAKLAKHRLCSDDRDLPGPVRVRKDILLDEVVLLGLRRDDLVERSILVEQQVRVTIAQDAGALGRQHEKLVSPVRDTKSPALVLPATLRVAQCVDLLLPCLVEFLGDVFVAVFVELIRGMISDGW